MACFLKNCDLIELWGWNEWYQLIKWEYFCLMIYSFSFSPPFIHSVQSESLCTSDLHVLIWSGSRTQCISVVLPLLQTPVRLSLQEEASDGGRRGRAEGCRWRGVSLLHPYVFLWTVHIGQFRRWWQCVFSVRDGGGKSGLHSGH